MPNAPRTFRPRPRASTAAIAIAPPSSRPADRPDRRGTSAERGYDATWSAFAAAVKARRPTCLLCWVLDGRAAATEAIDHAIPFGGLDDPLRLDVANVRGLCRSHHTRKTRRLDKRARGYFDAMRGRGASYERARDETLRRFAFTDGRRTAPAGVISREMGAASAGPAAGRGV